MNAGTGRLTDPTQRALRDLVLERTGLAFGDKRRAAFVRAVQAGLADSRLTDLPHYLAQLRAVPTNHPSWERLIAELTIGETYFFRDPGQMQALRQHILPGLIERHRADRTLRLWSAGCASGEEAYTLAILLRQILPNPDAWQIHLLATDLNRQALAAAEQARYRAWSFRDPDVSYRETYFTRVGDQYELRPEVRRMVSLAYLNLAEASYPAPATGTNQLDLILCRNVTLYLPPPVIRAVAARFAQCLAPGAWLMLAPSEMRDEFYAPLRAMRVGGALAYQRPLEESAAPEILAQPWAGAVPPVAPPPARRAPQPASAADLCAAARDLLARQRPLDARQRLLEAWRADPNYAPACSLLAKIEADRGQLEEAIQWALRALQINPLAAETHYTLALALHEQGRLEASLSALRKVLYLDPNFLPAHQALAQWLDGEAADRHRAQAARLATHSPA